MSSHIAMQHQNQHPDVSVFIKNLSEMTDEKTLREIFVKYGNIVSCKLAYDEKGKSKGYAFVQYENEAAARYAMEKANGMLVHDRNIYVGKFIPRRGRNKERDERNVYTNLYVKNFGNDFTEEQLRQLFEPYGKIKSHKIMTDIKGRSKGFGFVAFEKAEFAEEALQNLGGKKLSNGRKLYVARAQKKAERQQELQRQFEEQEERKRRDNTSGINLYVKNLDDTVTHTHLRREFSQYGPLTSARVMTDSSGRSKGFGFVRFVSAVDACFAAAGLNGRMFGSKPLYVSLAQRKEERRALLVAQHMRQRLQVTESYHIYRCPTTTTTTTTTDDNNSINIHQQQEQQHQQLQQLREEEYDDEEDDDDDDEDQQQQQQLQQQQHINQQSSSSSAQSSSSNVGGGGGSGGIGDNVSSGSCGGGRQRHHHHHKHHHHHHDETSSPSSQWSISPHRSQTSSGGDGCTSSHTSSHHHHIIKNTVHWRSSSSMARQIQLRPAKSSHCSLCYDSSSATMDHHTNPNPNPNPNQNHHPIPSKSASTTTSASASASASTLATTSCSINGGGGGSLSSSSPPPPPTPPKTPKSKLPLPLPRPTTQAALAAAAAAAVAAAAAAAGRVRAMPAAGMISVKKYSSYASFGGGGSNSNELSAEKQIIGERLFFVVEKIYPQFAGKITGMILEMSNAELWYLLGNADALRDKIEEAYQVYKAYLKEVRNSKGSGGGGNNNNRDTTD